MGEAPERPNDSRSVVPVVHFAVPEGFCVVVPAADLEDRERFGWWWRAYWSCELGSNEKWVEGARRHYQQELDRIVQGDGAALVAALATCPPIIEVPEVTRAVLRALLHCDGALFKRLGEKLERWERRHLSAEVRNAGVRRVKPTPAMVAALRLVGSVHGAHLHDSKVVKDAGAIAEGLGARTFGEAPGGRATKKALQRMKTLLRAYPKAIVHFAWDCVQANVPRHAGSALPAHVAPRLILGKQDEGASDRAAVSLLAVWPR